MTKDEDSSSGTKAAMIDCESIPLTSPLFLHPSENPWQLFGPDLLTDLNYNEWVSDMTETLIAKNKMAFVNGSLPLPAAGEGIRLEAWDRCDATVKGWLKTSMNKEVRNSVRGAKTAREIWLDLEQRFETSSAGRAYGLRGLLGSLRQEKLSVSAFYTKLRTLWDELQTVSINPRCTCGGCSCDIAKQTREKQEGAHLFDFLLGLDDTFSVVRSQILSSKPKPSLAEAYQQIETEEQQKQLAAARRPVVEFAAFHSRGDKDAYSEDKPRCSHCRKRGHTKDMCFRLIGYPSEQGKGRTSDARADRPASSRRPQHEGVSRAAQVDLDDSPIPGLTSAQFQQLKQFFNAPTSGPSDPTAHMAGIVTEPYEWLIDSGCNEHIVMDASWLDKLDRSDHYAPVRILNGRCIPVEGTGSVALTNRITLHRVLHVPEFKCISCQLVGSHRTIMWPYSSWLTFVFFRTYVPG
ncbi:unnamed protein product [Linum trigynum]|uniref:Retrovirus-related Pol polyprotein from transposon TNT 1-94-like beta-barrel domain-containing protein n=1 Tax=Linum trigynum TaxID=586398 RepID=A0AAV2FE66_9ROSI